MFLTHFLNRCYTQTRQTGDQGKLDAAYEQVASGSDPVVIVCPRGGGGAKRTYEYFAEKGIPADRLFILKGGQAGWPFEELLEE